MAGKPTSLPNARSVDELEMEMIGGGGGRGGGGAGGQNKSGRPMTVEELEREMRGQPIPVPPGGRPNHAPQHPVGTPPHGQYIQQNIKVPISIILMILIWLIDFTRAKCPHSCLFLSIFIQKKTFLTKDDI